MGKKLFGYGQILPEREGIFLRRFREWLRCSQKRHFVLRSIYGPFRQSLLTHLPMNDIMKNGAMGEM